MLGSHSTAYVNDNVNTDNSSDDPSSINSNSLSNSIPYNYYHLSTSALAKLFLLNINKNYFHLIFDLLETIIFPPGLKFFV